MLDNNEILYMIAHIGNKKLPYKYIKDYITLTGCKDKDIVEFQIVVKNDGTGIELVFVTELQAVTYDKPAGEIMEALYRGTDTQYIMFSDVLFHIDEFDFDVVKLEGEYYVHS